MDTQIKVTNITVEIGGTINLGNYENLRVGLSVSADVPEGMDVQAATQQVTTQVKGALLAQLREVESNVRGSAVFAALEDVGGTPATGTEADER